MCGSHCDRRKKKKSKDNGLFPVGFFFVFAVGLVIACLRKKKKKGKKGESSWQYCHQVWTIHSTVVYVFSTAALWLTRKLGLLNNASIPTIVMHSVSQMLKMSKFSCLSTANPVKPCNYMQCTSHKRVRNSRKTADESTSHSQEPFAQKTIRSLFGWEKVIKKPFYPLLTTTLKELIIWARA